MGTNYKSQTKEFRSGTICQNQIAAPKANVFRKEIELNARGQEALAQGQQYPVRGAVWLIACR